MGVAGALNGVPHAVAVPADPEMQHETYTLVLLHNNCIFSLSR